MTSPAPDARHDSDFVARATSIVRLGALLLRSGTASYRVKLAMQRTAIKLGMDRHESMVSLTEITSTAYQGNNFRTVVTEVQGVGVDASMIDAVQRVVRELPVGATAEQLNERLDEALAGPLKRWGSVLPLLAAGLACAAFAVLNRFAWWDLVPVTVAAALGQWARRTLAHRQTNPFIVVALAAVVACVVYWLLGLLDALIPGVPRVTDAGFVAAVLFLIPGFPMMTSILDLVKLDFTAGVSRVVYTFALILSATAAVWMVAVVVGLAPAVEATPMTPVVLWTSRVIASVVGIAGFAVLFNSTLRMVLLASGIGLLGNVARFLLLDHHASPQLACFVGGLVIGLLAAALAHPCSVPRITASVPASVIMVPGATIYRTMYDLNARDVSAAIAIGADCCLQCTAIALGLAVARIATDPQWRRGAVVTRADIVGEPQ